MIEIRREDFSVDEIIKKMKAPEIGALSIYLGVVREFPEGVGLEFPGDDQAARRLREIEERAISRFDVEDVAIVHRAGFLDVSENILLVAVSASHRGPAFNACQSIVDDIKDLHKSWGKAVSR
jgi:molybdopterin synthase catalytic subunit